MFFLLSWHRLLRSSRTWGAAVEPVAPASAVVLASSFRFGSGGRGGGRRAGDRQGWSCSRGIRGNVKCHSQLVPVAVLPLVLRFHLGIGMELLLLLIAGFSWDDLH